MIYGLRLTTNWRTAAAAGGLVTGVARVELGQNRGRDTLEHLLREDTQQLPADVERFEHGTVLVVALRDEVLLELGQELQVQQIVGRQGFLTDHSLHGLHVLTDGVASVQLVGHIRVILARHALTDGGLHQTRQRRQHVDRRIDLSVVQLTIDVDLTLGNVTGQIGNRMGDIVVRHSQNGDLGDRTVAALDTSGTLVDGGQIGVHVTGETTTSGYLLTGSRHLTQSLSVRGHVGQDDQHVLLALIGQELGGRQRQTGRNDTLDGRIVGQVQEQAHVLHGTVLFEVLLEESGRLHVHTHSGEHDGKVVLVLIQHRLTRLLHQTGLTTDLGSDFVVRQTGSREDGNLLSTGDRVHHIDGRDTGLNHFLGVDTGPRVDRLTLDVEEIFCQNWRSLVDGLTGAVEYTA
uniref:Putative secreted protein n=1 Tax=Anopheles darlingi TaxID=43151 RepID=A0A2M4D215_ANODA